MCYDIMDRNVFQGLGFSLAVMVVSFCFLVYAAGHRRGSEGIVLTWFDRIPVDVLSVCTCVAECTMLGVFFYIIRESNIYESIYACIWLFGIVGIAMTILGIEYVLSLCVRIKAGKWWRNSFCYGI